MEIVASANEPGFSGYGSTTHKQLYIYGGLDNSHTELRRAYGMAWGIGGWLLTPFLSRIGREATQHLRQRVADELTTIFASNYAKEISLAEALDLENIAVYNQRATGEKYLINPNKGLA
jgi:NADPH2:quinone reductase